MSPREIRDLLKPETFVPLRLHLSNGITFEVKNPALVSVGRRSLTLSLPPEDGFERDAIISLMHIIWIEKMTPTM
jgi:hypothetical protein